MKNNIKIGNIADFKQYSQFSSLKEFNTHIELWLLEHKHAFTKSELVALQRLVRFSAKLPGICNAKICTILKAIHEEYEDHGISRSSFKRMILKAKNLRILTVHETERKTGAQTSNLYIFNRFPQIEPPKQKILNHPNKTSNLIKSNHKNINKRKEERLFLDYTFTSNRVPKSFVNWVSIYFNDARMIEEFWKMANIAAYKYNRENDQELVLTLAITSFKQLIRKLKTTKTIKSPIGYFYGILKSKLDDLYFDELDDILNSPEETEEEFIYLNTIPKDKLLTTFQKWLESS